MKSIINIFFPFFFLLAACESNPTLKESVKNHQNSVVSSDSLSTLNKFKAAFNANFGEIKVAIKHKNNELKVYSNLKTIDTLNIPFNGKMLECIETDVDSNGFNEIYCISNLGDLVAFSSYNDISYGEIYIAQKPNYFYENFNGLNYWEAKDKKLYLSFSNGVENQMNVVRYSLKAGETSFQLLAE